MSDWRIKWTINFLTIFFCFSSLQSPQQRILREKNRVGRIMLPDFKLNYEVGNQESRMSAWKQTPRSMEQIREHRNEPKHTWSTNFWQGHPEDTRGKDSSFNRWCWGNWISTGKKIKLDSSYIAKKSPSKWIKDLNTKPEAIKILE